MVDQVDTIATELTLRYAQYVSGVDTVVQTNKRLNKSIADLSKLGVEAPPQYANAAASAAAKGAEAHEKAAARVKQARKSQVDVVKQSGSEEIAAEIATQQRLTKAVEDGIAARSNAMRRGSGTVLGATVPGRANNARQGLLAGSSTASIAQAEVEAEREINHLSLDTFDNQQRLKVLTGQRLADVERELELQRRIGVYKAGGLSETEAQVRAETRLVEMETLRAEKEAELALARKAGGRGGFGNANEFALQASGGRFGYSFSPGALAGVAAAAGVGIGVEAVKSATDYAQALTDVSKAAGISAEALQVYQHAAINAGAKSTDFDQAISELSNNLGRARTGAETQSKAFAALGIDIKGAASAGDLMPTLIDRISSIADQSKRAAVETALFGESGRKLDGLLAGGIQQINALAKALQDTGSILSSSDIAKLDDVSKKLEAVKAQLQVDVAETVAGNADAIERLAASFTHLVDRIGEAITAYGRFQNSPIGKAISAINQYDPTQMAARAIGRYLDNKGTVATQVGQSGTSVNLALGDDVQPGKVNNALLNSLNAPKGRKGPDLERQATERQKYIDDTLARYQDQELEAQQQRTANEAEQTRISFQQLKIAEDKALADIAANGKLKKLSEQQITNLQNAAKAAFDAERGVVARRDEQNITAEELALAQQRLDISRQDLESRRGLAQSAAERKRLDLLLLANAEEAERTADAPILADVNRPASLRRYSDTQIAEAQARAASAGQRHDQAVAGINREDAGPFQDYLNSLPDTADKINEAFQQAEVQGIQGFNNELGKTISGFLKLHGIAGQFLDDIVQIGIKWAEAQLFGSPGASGSNGGGLGSLFGGSSGGGIGGLFGGLIGKIFGGAGGSAGSGIGGSIGGSFLTGNSILGGGGTSFIDSALLALPGLAGGGTIDIGGRGGVDRNIMSLNGQPVARVNMGEQIHVVNPNQRVNGGGGGPPIVHQTIAVDARGAVMNDQFASMILDKAAAHANGVGGLAYSSAVRDATNAAPGRVAYDQKRGAS